MLKGDLTSTPLAPLLLDLAADSATGCLSVSIADSEEALVYLKSGLVYAISVPGTRPQLGAKLVSSGALAPEALSEALEAQRTELQGWRLGELLVHLGYVDQPVVEAFVKEQVQEALWDLMRWTEGRWKFRKNARTREDVGPPMIVVDLLESLRARGYEWESISAVVHGPMAVPTLSARGDSAAETTLDNDAWSMLCKIDGERTVAELARDCGYTLFEAGHVIVSLVQAGLVDIDEDVDVEGSAMYGASTLTSAFAGEVDETPEAETDEELGDAFSRLAQLVTEVAADRSDDDGFGDGSGTTPAQRQPEPDLDHSMTVPLHRNSNESFAASIARVSGALSDVLGPPAPVSEEINPLLETRKAIRQNHPTDKGSASDRRRRLRSAAAAELVNAQALADALRPDRNTEDELPSEEAPRFVDDAQAASRAAEEAARHAAEVAAREAAERFARAAAEEAERLAAEQEASRAAAEEAARVAEEQAAREAAERAAAEEAERLAREEAERAAAAAEAEQAAVDEAARLAAEREAAETDAWAEYWTREEAERAAREEAERVAAEDERLAAVQEAERVAAEEQAARLAAEEEAARVAAEEEATRLAAEQEAERVVAELEAARLAAEQDAERRAAEQAAAAEEAERLEAEQKAAERAERAARRKAEKAEAAQAAQRADEAAAAHALLIELNASSAAEPEAAEPEPTVEPEPEPEPANEPEPVSVGIASNGPDVTDTAALLRELSSLSDEDEERPQLTAPRAHRPIVDEKKPRKKIGLFGL